MRVGVEFDGFLLANMGKGSLKIASILPNK